MICCVPNCAYLSETSRMLAIYDRLLDLGEDVILATHGGTYSFLLRDAGVPIHLLDPVMSDAECARFVASGPGLGATGQPFYRPGTLEDHVRAEATFFQERNVRAVLTGFAVSTLLSCRVAGISQVVSHIGSWIPPIFERGMHPPISKSMVPGAGLMPRSVNRWLANVVPPRLRWYCAEYDRVARRLGVEGPRTMLDLLIGDYTLVTDVPEILGIPSEELERWESRHPGRYRARPRFRYVGAIFAKAFGDIPSEIEQLLAEGGPKVYVALTSTATETVQRVVDVLRDIPVRAVVATTVHGERIHGGDNILTHAFLPSHRIMPKVDLAITTGGQGSMQTAIAAGTPVIGVPLHPEQDFNVHLVARRGAGLAIAPRQLRSPMLRRAIETMLADTGYQRAAQQLKRWQDAVDGPLEAAREVARIARAA
jgi:UDP:flavonoid glycosyltransferase YjiC (YdhE family)